MNVIDFTAEAQMTDVLEKRVGERTRELTEANERLQRQHEEQIRIDDQLRQAKERAEEAVSSKTRFFAAASHDLLQPVNAAKLLISTMTESTSEKVVAETVSRLERSFKSIESCCMLCWTSPDWTLRARNSASAHSTSESCFRQFNGTAVSLPRRRASDLISSRAASGSEATSAILSGRCRT